MARPPVFQAENRPSLWPRPWALVPAVLLSLACSVDAAAPSSPAGGAGSQVAGQSGSSTTGGVAHDVGGQPFAGQPSAPNAGTAGMAMSAGGATMNAGGAAGSSSHSAGGGTGGSSGGVGTGGVGTGGTGSSDGKTPIKIWLAGDSTVQECSGTCPCGWGSRFDPLFNDQVTVVNRAVGGRSIQTWLYEAAVTTTLGADGECTLSSQTYDKRWSDMLNASSGMKAGDYLFIQFGINDGDKTCPRHVGLTAFQTYLSAMAQAAKERGVQAVLVTPVSAIACSGNMATKTRGAFVDATKAAAAASGVPVIDLHQLSITLYDSLGFCPNDADYTAGDLGAFFCDDHTHFEAAGAVKIAELVGQALKDQSLGLAAYLR